MVDSSGAGDGSEPVAVGEDAQVVGELAGDLGHLIDALDFGPLFTERAGVGPSWARHAQIIRTPTSSVVVANNSSTPLPFVVVVITTIPEAADVTVTDRIGGYTPQIPAAHWENGEDFIRSCRATSGL